jgi:hypothetical protein
VHLTVTSGPLSRIPTNAIHAAALGAATSNAPLMQPARVHDMGTRPARPHERLSSGQRVSARRRHARAWGARHVLEPLLAGGRWPPGVRDAVLRVKRRRLLSFQSILWPVWAGVASSACRPLMWPPKRIDCRHRTVFAFACSTQTETGWLVCCMVAVVGLEPPSSFFRGFTLHIY